MSEGNGTLERRPPSNTHAEQSLLGSMLRDNATIDSIVGTVSARSFYLDAHQKICAGIYDLYRRRTPVDLVTLAEWLKKNRCVEDIGGYAYLAELWEAAPTAANFEYYAKIVREHNLFRKTIHTVTEVLRECYEPFRPADEMLASAETTILKIASDSSTGSTVEVGKAARETLDIIDERQTSKNDCSKMLLSGFQDLDEKTAGLHAGEITVLAARPSVGKTSLALSVLSNVSIDRKYASVFFSLEQSRIEVCERLLAFHSRVALMAIRKARLSNADTTAILEATGRLDDAPMEIDDSPRQTIMTISANARRLHQRRRLKLIVVDYLQLIEPENTRENRNEQIGKVTRGLKLLARELQLPILVLSQLNRDAAKDDKPPKLHHLRDSGNIEADADNVWMLHRLPDTPTVVEIYVEKQRNGPTGNLSLTFNRQLTQFENFAPDIP